MLQIIIITFLYPRYYISPGVKTKKKTKTRLEWLRVDFIFSREGLAAENGVISLNEHADSLGKVTTVKRVARVFRDLIIIVINYAEITVTFNILQHWLSFFLFMFKMFQVCHNFPQIKQTPVRMLAALIDHTYGAHNCG